MENHYFNINVASKYGINCAIILQNIFYWVKENERKQENYIDGKYWTYNSIKELSKQFPYLTERQIRTALETLKDEELVLTGNHNKSCNRTLWYTVTEKALNIMNNTMVEENQVSFSNPDEETIVEDIMNSSESILEGSKCQNDLPSKSNGNDTQVKTIGHTGQNDLTSMSNVTNNKPQIINTDKLEKEIYKEKEDQEQEIFNFWNSKNLIQAEVCNNYTKAVISTALKSFTLEQIKTSIERYNLVYNSKHFFNHCWKLESFLGGKAIRNFLNNGEHWINYCNWKNKQQNNGFIHNSYSQEQIDNIISDLDSVEV